MPDVPRMPSEQLLVLQAAIQSNDVPAILASLMILLPAERAGHFVGALVKLGKQDSDNAERVYCLAITLYEKHFPDEHSGGLSAMCALARLLDEQNRESDISAFLEKAYPLVLRAAKGIGKDHEENNEGNGKAAALKILRNGHSG